VLRLDELEESVSALGDPLESNLGWNVAEGGGKSIGFRGKSLSGEFPSAKVEEEELKGGGGVGSGLSGERVWDMARSGRTFGFSERKGLSMTMSLGRVDRVKIRR
jgi:hypothetical protein